MGLFFGLKVAVLGAVTETVLRVGRRALNTRLGYEAGNPNAYASHGEDRLGGTIPNHAAATFSRAVRVQRYGCRSGSVRSSPSRHFLRMAVAEAGHPSCFDVNTAQEPEPFLMTVPRHALADHPAGGDEYYTCMKLLALNVQGVEP